MGKHDDTKKVEDEQKPINADAVENSAESLSKEDKVKEFEDKWKRAMADYRNLENRMSEQRSEWVRSANRELLLRLLPIFDTLQLAHQHTQDKTLAVSIGQFQDILKSEGVVKIDVVGKDFDPNIMEAISATEGEENKVIDELRAGFMLYDKILRPAQVRVGSGK